MRGADERRAGKSKGAGAECAVRCMHGVLKKLQ
jgi:hypothetical protein